ncbi:MAG TPA: hypothetical protein VHP33_37740 [Polyangiaceae bacterium]|nr:hypothetical protein [Polyangiaceae bacterium]
MRAVDTMGDPSVMAVMHSIWQSPRTLAVVGGSNSALMVASSDVFAR